MNLIKRLWNDEIGAVLAAEAVMIGTLGVVAVSTGIHTVSHAVNAELVELGQSIRSLDQSYSIPGFAGCKAYTAHSGYVQQDVAKSLEDLCGLEQVVPERSDRDDHDHKHEDRKKK